MSRTARLDSPRHLWFGVAGLAWITASELFAPALEAPTVRLASLALLPAVLIHLALDFPTQAPLLKTYPSAVWVPYLVCAVPAAVGVRSVARGPEGALVLTTIALGLSAIGGVVLIARLLPSRFALHPPAVARARRIALAGSVVSLLGLALRPVVPQAQAALPAFAVAMLFASAGLQLRGRSAEDPPAEPRGPDALTLEQIAPGIAHAMRKPLAVVSDHLRSLERSSPVRGQISESIELLAQVQRLVESVLHLARVQSRPRARRLNLRSLIEQAVSDVGARFPEACIESRSADGFLMADEVSLRCLLVNLMENALEIPGTPGWVRVWTLHEGDWVQIEVEDQGGGIPESMRARLFEPFVTAKPGGTGLGLATVREVARAHAGSVEAIDTPRGTRFVIRLPARAR